MALFLVPSYSLGSLTYSELEGRGLVCPGLVAVCSREMSLFFPDTAGKTRALILFCSHLRLNGG